MVRLESTLGHNWSGRCISITFPFCRSFCTIFRAGDLRSEYGLGQKFYLSDFDNIGDSYSLPSRGLSNNGRLNAIHTKLSFKCVPSFFLTNHYNLIRLLQISDNSINFFRQHAIPRVKRSPRRLYFQHSQHLAACKFHCLWKNPPVSEQQVPHITLDATNSGFNGTTTNGHSIEVQHKSGYLLYRATLKQRCQLEDMKQTTMFTDHSKEVNLEAYGNHPV